MTPETETHHAAQERENEEPEERIRPVPLAAVIVTLTMVLFGVVYIFLPSPLAMLSLGTAALWLICRARRLSLRVLR